MFNLIKNELFKSIFRLRTYISIVIIVMITALMSFIPTLFADSSLSKSFSGDDWKEEASVYAKELNKERDIVLQDINSETDPESMESMVNEAHFNELSEEINKINYSIDENTPVVSSNNLFGNILSNVQSSTLITILIIILAASILPEEHKYGTIKLLLIRPAGRIKILLSKLIAVAMSILLYMFFALVTVTIFSLFVSDINKSIDYVYLSNGTFEASNFIILLIKNLLAQFITVFIISLIAYSFSIIIPSTSLVITLTLALYFMAEPVLILINSQTDIGQYLWFTYWDFTQFMAPNTQFINSDATLTNAIIVNSIYFIPLIIFAVYFFKRRDILT